MASAVTAGVQGADYPTRLAILPMIVDQPDLPSAYALQSASGTLAQVVGPAMGGLLITGIGLAWVYLIDVASYGATFLAALLLPNLTPHGGGTAPTLRSMADGLRFLRTESLLSATFILDLNAMLFGMPKAVFPALGTGLFKGGAATLGHLYAAPGAGALVASLLSGWVRNISAHARALVICMLVWGGCIVAFGLIPVLAIGLVLLAVAGGADMIGGVFRISILQARTPQEMQGRLGGLFFAAAVAGNRLGDGETGLAAGIGGPQFAVWSGGAACLVGTAVLAWLVPALWRDQPGPVRRSSPPLPEPLLAEPLLADPLLLDPLLVDPLLVDPLLVDPGAAGD